MYYLKANMGNRHDELLRMSQLGQLKLLENHTGIHQNIQ